MKTGVVFVEAVQVGQRHRTLDPKKIGLLADSMSQIGLQQPISVWSPDLETIVLVAGLHRLEAARKLGWDEIDCVYVDMSETEREMWEIAENLHRVDLSKEERDNHIRRYAELLEKRKEAGSDNVSHPGYDARGQRKSEQQQPGIASQVADGTGLSKRTVERVLNPPDSTVPNDEIPDQEKVYDNLCKWWRKADRNTRDRFAKNWLTRF